MKCNVEIIKRGEKNNCKLLTRAKVSTRNKWLPLDLTSWEKGLFGETEGENGSNVEVLYEDDGTNLETPKVLNPVNWRTCLQTAAIRELQSRIFRRIGVWKTFTASQLTITGINSQIILVLCCVAFSVGNRRGVMGMEKKILLN